MKLNMFSGWSEVFLFTLKQGLSRKYKITTLVLAAILLAAGLAYNIISATGQKNDDNISPVEKVYVLDESGIAGLGWNDLVLSDKEQFPNVFFEQTQLSISELGAKLAGNEPTSLIIKISKAKESIEITAYIPYNSVVSKSDGENLAKALKSVLRQGLINSLEIDGEMVTFVTGGINTDFCTVGEDAKSDNMTLLTILFPMIFMIGMYFMIIIYGQSMGQIVSIEKSSKLMETLLVMTRPYGLIFGKIIATSLIAIAQIAVWILATVAGFAIGAQVAVNAVYSGYNNRLLSLFREIAEDDSIKAFTTEAIVLTVIVICLAFLFYCMLAAAIASFASKADELGTVMMFYNMFLILGFFGSYILPSMIGKEWIKVVIRLIPMSAAFILPGEILVGTVLPVQAIIYILVLFAWIVITALFAGKVYKNQVFYRGMSLKDRLPWTKSQKDESDEQWQYLHDEAGRPLEKSQKIGYFFLSLSPLVIFVIIQVLASLVILNVMTRIDFRGIDIDSFEIKDFVDYYHGIEPTLNPLTMMVIHLLIIATFGTWMHFIREGSRPKNIIYFRTPISQFRRIMNPRNLPIVGLCIVSGLLLCAVANGVVAIEAALIPSVVEKYIESAGSSGMGISPFAIFATVCLAPIGEEFLCRGVSLSFAKKAFGNFWYANILQALLFGALHMNWVQGVYAFLIGLVLGFLVEKCDSLLPAMLVHFTVNFSSSTWIPKVLGDYNFNLTQGIILLVVGGITTIGLMYFSWEHKVVK